MCVCVLLDIWYSGFDTYIQIFCISHLETKHKKRRQHNIKTTVKGYCCGFEVLAYQTFKVYFGYYNDILI